MFEMRLQGLFTLATIGSKRYAVMYAVDREPHLSLMTIREGDLTDPQHAPAGDYVNSGKARCYALREISNDKLATVTTDLPSDNPSAPPIPGIVSLSDPNVTNGKDPQDSIGNFVPSLPLPVLIEVPDGTIYVRNWFHDKADFGGGANCAPRTTSVLVNTNEHVEITVTNVTDQTTRIIDLEPDSLVYFGNCSRAVHPTMHYDVVANFFKNSTDGHAVYVNNPTASGTCTLASADDAHDTCATGSTAGIECTHNQFP